MTELLNKAFQRVSALSPEQQDEIARALLAQIDDDAKWDASLSSPKGKSVLKRLADEAAADITAGRVINADPSTSAE
jgi:ABC-type phosphate/phosphonate transport system ATPase subunit